MLCIILLTSVDLCQEVCIAVRVWPFCLHFVHISFHNFIFSLFAVSTSEFTCEHHIHQEQTGSLASFLASIRKLQSKLNKKITHYN